MIDYIKGANLRRGYDYVKIHKGEEDEYTPVMTIMCDTAMGRSFMITLDALWKYDEPKENRDAALMQQDMQEFQAICDRVIFHERVASEFVTKARAAADRICVTFAKILNQHEGILLCTGYNLAKCMQMMGITFSGPAAAQLLMWIQDGLDKLKDMPPHELSAEEALPAGEVVLNVGGVELTKELTMTQAQIIEAEEG